MEKERSLVPSVVKGDAADRIMADFKREATALEISVVQRALKSQVKRRNRAKKEGITFVIE
ncbi:MAG: hypothetical protein ACXVC1_03610 [Tumebacillaceae bacterium]